MSKHELLLTLTRRFARLGCLPCEVAQNDLGHGSGSDGSRLGWDAKNSPGHIGPQFFTSNPGDRLNVRAVLGRDTRLFPLVDDGMTLDLVPALIELEAQGIHPVSPVDR